MTQTVFVCQVPTFYEVIGIGATAEEAILVASEEAHKMLRASESLTEETDTPGKLAKFFSLFATEVPVGTAVIR